MVFRLSGAADFFEEIGPELLRPPGTVGRKAWMITGSGEGAGDPIER
jgi:hypothetical protein